MEHQTWILRSVLTQLERQEAEDEEASDGIAGEFVRLKSLSTKYRTDKTYPSKSAEKQDNVKKNRYKDIVPFDHTRVKLTLNTSKNDTDYINASFIKGVSGSRAYIATQGPLPHTVLDFLRMLWEYNIQVLVMACREFEMGKKKCERYWPQKQDEAFVCEPFTVYCDSEESKGDYLTRTLRVTYRNCSRTLKQLHYVNWPDHGVPDSIPPILEMLDEMRSYQDNDDIPIVIHCSAGCGRTGALCVIDYTWNLLKKQIMPSDFSIYNLVKNMRTQRPSLVQTKEQYELVYRTIKLLFEKCLLSSDDCRSEVPAVPPAITPDFDSDLSDLSEDSDLLLQIQQLLEKEKEAPSQYRTAPLPSTSEGLTAPRAADSQQSLPQQWLLQQTLPEPQDRATWELQEEPVMVHSSQREEPAEEERTQENDSMPSLNPPPTPTVTSAICMMVEDPYFDTPLSSPSSEVTPMNSAEDSSQWKDSPSFSMPSVCLNDRSLEQKSTTFGTAEDHTDEDDPPPLPQRTPESYVLAVDAEPSDSCGNLLVVIPPNAAAEAVKELNGSPPSPVPPLPERTPESYELAVEQAPVEPKLEVAPAVNLNRIGMSSEWCGNTEASATASEDERKPWARSRSLKVKMTFTVPAASPDIPSNTTPNLQFPTPPVESPTPLLLHQEQDSSPPLPDRTPESFILSSEHGHQKTTRCPQPTGPTHPSPTVGSASEWSGVAQPKKFLDAVMSRSKSVRPKGSKHEPLTVTRQLTSPPVVVAEGGSAQATQHDANRRPSLNNEASGNKSDKTSEKSMSRTRSLRFFRQKQKSKSTPPPPAQPGTSRPLDGTSFSVFSFGFGNRFGKPKGPRSYPETWV
ncbi:uncharacterized protein V6R79_023443 [Siganus canaliculatus]